MASPIHADADASVSPRPAPLPQPDIIVGSERGLEAWRADGNGKRVISAVAARSPRRLDEESVVVVVSRDPSYPPNLANGATLERISLANGERRRLASLPRFSCKRSSDARPDEQPDALGLSIQEPIDFIIDKSRRRACLSLMDRNANMADVAVDVSVDLATGKVRRWLTMGSETCTPPTGVKIASAEDVPRCSEADKASETSHTRQPFPFEFTKGGILRQRGKSGTQLLKMRGYEPDSLPGASPSGRWAILRGDVEEADYIHAKLLLLDRERGEVFPIREGRPWPAPLQAEGNRGLPEIKTPVEKTIPVVGETDVCWLGDSAESELLIVDDLVVKPGQYAFAVKGEVAR
jgi:hypothetical protein